jgi:hypothetical protein
MPEEVLVLFYKTPLTLKAAMATMTLSSYRTAKKMIRQCNNISFLHTCKSLKLIPNGLRATIVFLNKTNSPRAQNMANKHSRQWLKVAIDIQ